MAMPSMHTSCTLNFDNDTQLVFRLNPEDETHDWQHLQIDILEQQ